MAAERSPLLAKGVGVPPALNDRNVKRLPQAIAHRGYKAAFPENTMGAFRGAVVVGSHAIETDLHLSKDGVVVLSHDATLERCFGRKEKIADCDWSYLSGLKTVRAPHEPMARLVDLLAYLAEPGLEDIWLILDIKRDDDPDELLGKLAAAIASVPAPRPWRERIVLGCWHATYVDLCKEYLGGFPTAYIGFSLLYAVKLLKEPNVNFNLLQQTLIGPCGTRFLAAAHKAGRSVFAWTINEEETMEWAIRKGVDGVITDYPELFLEVCRRHGEPDGGAAKTCLARRPPRRKMWRVRHVVSALVVHILTTIATAMLFFKGTPLGRRRRRKGRSP